MERVNFTGSTRKRIQAYFGKASSVVPISCALFIALCVTFSIHQQSAPEAAPSSVPKATFSAGRAMNHLVAIAKKPHPMGSTAHSAVRDYIMETLSEAGVEPELQKALGINRAGGTLRVGAVENILVRLKGVTEGKAVLLLGHYDSAPNSMGASDDGSAVAVLLETLDALRSGPALKNDVIFLFSDGEECGLLGANAFIDEHRWAKDVGVVLNFEARGNSGPAIMFETSDDNRWLIREFANSAPAPIAHSLSYEIYRLLPNDTDFTVFKKAGVPGLNFAYINGLGHYHTLLDKPDEVDERSLQHQGSYALSLTRHLGNLDLRLAKESGEGSAIYFDLFGKILVHYSIFWTLPLAVLVLALFAALIIVGFNRGRLTLWGISVGFLALVFSILVSSLMTLLLLKGIALLHKGAAPSPHAVQSDLLLIGIVAWIVAVTSTIYLLVRDRASVESLTTGAMLWWLILMVVTVIFLPGGSFLFAWPLCFSLIGLGWMMLAKERGKGSTNLSILLAVWAMPVIVLTVPTTYQIFIALTLDWAAVVIGMVVLILGLLVPHLQLITVQLKWWLPGCSVIAGFVIFAVGSLMFIDGVRYPRQNSILYGLNADSGKAVWASDATHPDEWTSQFFAGGVERGTLPDFFYADSSKPFLKSSAQLTSLSAPRLELITDTTLGGIRTMRMRLSSPRQAAVMSVYIDSEAEVLKAIVNEKPVEDDQDHTPAARERKHQWAIRIFGFPRQGMELQWEVRAIGPLKIRLVDQSYGIPELGGVAFKSRPQSLIPSTASYTDSTFLSKSFIF